MGALTKPQAGRFRYDPDLECVVEVRPGSNYFAYNELRSDLAAPAVHAGGMPTIKSMADGRFYETKRNYLKSVARAGCEVVGFDRHWQEHIKPAQAYGGEKAHEASIVADVKQAIEVETSKLPPAGTVAHRKLVRKQRRQNRARS